MLNQVILEILKRIQADTPQAFSRPRQVTAFLKDLTENNSQYSAVIRWLEISLADFDAYACIKGDYLETAENHTIAKTRIYNGLINEGASPDIAKEITDYWAVLAGSTEESVASNNFDDAIKAGIAYLESGDTANAIAYLTRASSSGSPLALYKLSVCHVDNGNMPEAFARCKEAAETDVAAWPKDKETIALAQYQLAMYYGLGDGGASKSPEKEFYWVEKAGENGNIEAFGRAGYYLYHGVGIEKDEDEGLSRLTQAANLGDKIAPSRVAEIWMHRAISSKGDISAFDKAIEWCSIVEKNRGRDIASDKGINALKQMRESIAPT